ncbi:MAG: hypothetical protein SynsKO_36660 [Synoicihabitans sp.]
MKPDQEPIPLFQIWLQVTLEDNVAEYLYSPLFFTVIATIIAAIGWIPVSWEILLSASIVMLTLLIIRGLRNFLFLRTSLFIPAQVGMKTGRFRKYIEHEVKFECYDQQHCVKFAFQKGEVKEGELLVVAVKKSNPKKLMIVQRASDDESLLDL